MCVDIPSKGACVGWYTATGPCMRGSMAFGTKSPEYVDWPSNLAWLPV